MSSVRREAFYIAGYPIYWYGIVIAIGVLAAFAMSIARERRVGVPKDTTVNIALFAIPAGLVFARLYYVAFSFDQYANDLKQIFNIRQGGMAIWGGVIGGSIAVFFYTRIKKVSFLRFADLLSPGLVLAQGIGRWGNFFNQEAYGIQILNPKLQFFPLSVFIEAEGAWFAATFFYESIWCILTSFLLIWIESARRQRATGDLFFWYLILYGFERSIVEGLRLDSLMLGNIRVSQLLSIALVILSALVFYIRLFRLGINSSGKIAYGVLLALGLFAPVLLIYGLLSEYMIIPAALVSLFAAIAIYHSIPIKKGNEGLI